MSGIRNMMMMPMQVYQGNFSFVNAVQATGNANSNVTSAINTSGVKLIVVCCDFYKLAPIPPLTDSKNNIWVQLTRRNGAGNIVSSIIFYCINPTTDSSHTFTIIVSCFSSNNNISYLAENGSTATATTSLQTGSIAPSQKNCLVVTGVNTWTVNAPSINLGFSVIDSHSFIGGSSFAASAAYLITNSTASLNPTWSFSKSSADSSSVIAVFETG
jgi:hypothetical protein